MSYQKKKKQKQKNKKINMALKNLNCHLIIRKFLIKFFVNKDYSSMDFNIA